MSTHELFTVLSGYYPLTEEIKVAFEKELVPLSLPKNHLLVEVPMISDRVYFLQSGFAMSYTHEKNEKVVDAFWKPGQIMFSFYSLFEQTPSFEYIQLMENSTLFCLNNQSLLQLLDEFPEVRMLYRIIINRCYIDSRSRVRDVQRLSATERHAKLLRMYEGIEQSVSQENIASWLGITPQSLSRIKRRHHSTSGKQ